MDKDPQAKLQQLFIEYGKKLPEKIAEIDKLWQQLSQHWNKKDLDNLYRCTHTLTGSAGTYGYLEISNAARNIVNQLKKYLEKPSPNESEIAEIDKTVQFLKTLHENISLTVSQEQFMKKFSEDKILYLSEIYFLGKDQELMQKIQMQLDLFGYKIRKFGETSELQSALKKLTPAVIIIDINTLSKEDKVKLLENNKGYQNIPLMIISQEDDLKSHLEAVRLGNASFFIKPLEIGEFANKIKQIFDAVLNPYRILIVEDSKEMADYFAAILRQAGMKAFVVTNPTEINKALSEFKPELILMDIYMPKISGLELAAVLRQQSTYASIPIVFLSAEDNKTKQLEAMSLGGDDFITKPVTPAYLIWSVKNRAERYRELRRLMSKDGLTGLFNHTSIQTQLEIELTRAERENLPLTFVMIDIDHFKKVNDSYGHQMGDQVLKTLSLLLQQRLRRSDIVGRYGGEEFALILPNTTYENAFEICETIRKSFAELRYVVNKKDFIVTFSAGIASKPPHKKAAELIKAADEALYRAKQAGRNCSL